MLESEFLAWLALAMSFGFIMALPLLSDGMPDYEPRNLD
jgi:hypothetical protein